MIKFLVTCAARTGSTMLRHLLDSHPEILCHGEVFESRGIMRFLRFDHRSIGLTDTYQPLADQFKKLNIPSFIDSCLLQPNHEQQKAVGFKFKTDEYFDSSFAQVSRHIKVNNDIQIIHLRRKDLLAQYISHQKVLLQNGPTVNFSRNYSSDNRLIKVDIRHLLNFMKDVTYREREIQHELADHEMINVWYEDIILTESKVLSDILEFIGVQVRPLYTTTTQIIQNHYDLVPNIDDVLESLKNTEFMSRLKDGSLV